MKQLLLYSIAFLFMSLGVSAQAENHVINKQEVVAVIDGYIINQQDSTAIPNCSVILKSENFLEQIRSDSNGYYRYEFNVSGTREMNIYTITDKTVTSKTATLGFLASDEHKNFRMNKDSVALYRKNFILTPVLSCGPIADNILFGFQSEEFDSTKCNGNPDWNSGCFMSSIGMLISNMKRTPTVVIEINAHCSSNEKQVEKLSIERAERVKKELMERGVEPARIICKAWGIKKLRISDTQIKKERTKEGKEALHAINRRVSFKVVSWDYGVPNGLQNNMPVYIPPSRGKTETN